MTQRQDDDETAPKMGIPDEALPEDLVAGEDNPLAEGLPPGETAEGLLDPAEGAEEDTDEDTERGVQTGSAPQEQ